MGLGESILGPRPGSGGRAMWPYVNGAGEGDAGWLMVGAQKACGQRLESLPAGPRGGRRWPYSSHGGTSRGRGS